MRGVIKSPLVLLVVQNPNRGSEFERFERASIKDSLKVRLRNNSVADLVFVTLICK